jgi:uncharacterized repeat protein (TIGR02543 family)
MKKRNIFSLFTLVFVILGLFAACGGLTEPNADPAKSGSGYTVRFEANSGSPAPVQQYISDGGKVVMPPAMTKTGYSFGGWYTEAACTNQWDFATDTVSGNITLYAKWDVTGSFNCTVTFNANDGSPAPDQQSISNGDKIVMPPAITKTDYIFGGWYKEAACTNQWDFATDTVSDNITLYAGWFFPTPVTGTTLADKLQWLRTNAASNSGYILEVPSTYEKLAFQNLSYTGKKNITVQLKGGSGSSKIIDQSDSSSLFQIGNGVTLILDENLTLLGNENNSASLVQVNSGGTLIINQGVKITGSYGGNTYSNNVVSVSGTFTMNGGEISGSSSSNINNNVVSVGGTFTMNSGKISGSRGVYVGGTFTMIGGEISGSRGVSVYGTFTMIGGKISGNSSSGVYVSSSGTFTMNDGEISGNSSSYGGGVYVTLSGIFTMNSGEISGNSSSYDGGGVYVSNGTFTMSGGKISDNTVTSSSYDGGGVYVSNGTFTMNSGEISGNSSPYGGGVYVSNGTFTMNSGEISDNSSSYGGGVYVTLSGTFTMNSGEISDNSSSSGGGGVYVNSSGTFTMIGGEISDNTATSSSSRGGGVYVNSSGTFTMNSGEISGNSSSSGGGGVYVNGSQNSFFNKTSGTIYGYTIGDSKSNVVKNNAGDVQNDQGHAVYVDNNTTSYIKRKETTAGPTDDLSYIGRVTPVWGGEWDF